MLFASGPFGCFIFIYFMDLVQSFFEICFIVLCCVDLLDIFLLRIKYLHYIKPTFQLISMQIMAVIFTRLRVDAKIRELSLLLKKASEIFCGMKKKKSLFKQSTPDISQAKH